MVILSLSFVSSRCVGKQRDHTYSKWDMHHAATMPLVAALAPRDVIPRLPRRTLRVSDKIDPMAPEAK